MTTEHRTAGLEQLLREVRKQASIDAPHTGPLLSDERLLAALHGKRPLTPAEHRLLLDSADTREQYTLLAQMERARALQAWRERGISGTIPLRLAAADETAKPTPLHYPKEMYTLDLIPIDAQGKEWRINLRVTEEFAKFSKSGVQLVDSEGLVWLEGHPDESGELVGFWARDESLWERIHRVELQLLPR